MKRKRKVEIVVEREQVVVIRGLETRTAHWCPRCGGLMRMLSAEDVATIAGVIPHAAELMPSALKSDKEIDDDVAGKNKGGCYDVVKIIQDD